MAFSYAKTFLHQGKVATYIPELALANENDLGAYVAMPTGESFSIGQCDTLFTMQSISKIITLIVALQVAGYDKVFQKVGMEPTGDPFNSMIKLESKTAKPSNPMINAGAIVVTSLIDTANPLQDILELTQKLTMMPEISINEKVYLSEKSKGMRNRSMAYFMMSEDIISGNIEQHLEHYFRACSIQVSSKGLAHMGMILANNGVNPITNEVVVADWQVRIVKTLMMTCGLYDGSGEFALKVGIPSKSGVGGGITSACANGMGIGVYGPALDHRGTSVGGIHLLEYLSQNLGLHLFSGTNQRCLTENVS